MNLQRILAFVLALLWVVPALAGEPHAGAPAASPIKPGEPGSAAVGKLLSPGQGDPDVPLPSPQVSGNAGAGKSDDRPRPYARQETGGGVLGLRFPIPVTPGASGSDTRYSSRN